MTTASGEVRNALVDEHAPEALVAKFKLQLPDEGRGKEGALELFEKVLKYSVNTWDQGFMDKLYSSNTPVSAAFPCSRGSGELQLARTPHSAQVTDKVFAVG